jgi:hypothetical protein
LIRFPSFFSLDVYIVSYARTPLTNAFTGSLAGYTAPQLAGFAIEGKKLSLTMEILSSSYLYLSLSDCFQIRRYQQAISTSFCIQSCD